MFLFKGKKKNKRRRY